jgi:hypothetical protein
MGLDKIGFAYRIFVTAELFFPVSLLSQIYQKGISLSRLWQHPRIERKKLQKLLDSTDKICIINAIHLILFASADNQGDQIGSAPMGGF